MSPRTTSRTTSRVTSPGFLKERRAVIAAAKSLRAASLVHGREGNVVLRAGGSFLVTPTGINYEALKPAHIVWLNDKGVAAGKQIPSSEWRFYLHILATQPEINAVMHTHSMFAIVPACQDLGILAFTYMVAFAGGRDIRCAPYATFGTQGTTALTR